MSNQKVLFIFFAIYCASGMYLIHNSLITQTHTQLKIGMSWRQIFTVGGVAVAGFLYLIYSQQEKILYLNETIPPKRTSENPSPFANPKQQGMDYEDVYITTKDNIKLHAWWIPYKSPFDHRIKLPPTLIFYHANAGSLYIPSPYYKPTSLHSYSFPFFATKIWDFVCRISMQYTTN